MTIIPTFSRPPTPPKRTSSMDSNVSSASAASSNHSGSSGRTSMPTNTLIITNLTPGFFEPKVLNALKQHFASYSKTFLHRPSPYSPVTTSDPGPSPLPKEDAEESERRPQNDDDVVGDLYAWAPLKGLKRAIVVYYSAEEAEQARMATDRVLVPRSIRGPATVLRVFRAPNTVLTGYRPKSTSSPQQGEEGAWYEGGYNPGPWEDESEIKESPFHLRPPVTERNFLISPPGSPPVGWVAIREEPPNEVTLADDLKAALEKVQRSQLGAEEDAAQELEGEDGVLLIPESAAGICVRVENWSRRRQPRRNPNRSKDKKSGKEDGSTASSVLSEMEDELDEDLDDIYSYDDDGAVDEAEWDHHSAHSWKGPATRVWGAKPLPASMPPTTSMPATHPQLSLLTDTNPYLPSMVPTSRPPMP